MKRPWTFVLVLAVIVVPGATWWHRPGPSNPLYKGKHLSEWMQDVGGCTVSASAGSFPANENIREKVMSPSSNWVEFTLTGVVSEQPYNVGRAAIKAIGTNAIPFVQPMLMAQDSALRSRLDPCVHRLPWLERRYPTPIFLRQRAMAVLLGLDEKAVPFLIEVFEDEASPTDARCFAASNFRVYPEFSSGALPALKRAQLSPDPLLAKCSKQAIEEIERWELRKPIGH